jgi:hypothetical protein
MFKPGQSFLPCTTFRFTNTNKKKLLRNVNLEQIENVYKQQIEIRGNKHFNIATVLQYG